MSAILDGTCLDMSIALTPQARLRAIMQQAAQLERGGLFDDAALYWQRGRNCQRSRMNIVGVRRGRYYVEKDVCAVMTST